MMRDRPAMANLVHKGDVIYEYAARQFGGASSHRRILWDSTPPQGHYTADNGRRRGVSQIRIQIRNSEGKAIGAQELWSCAIFELLNSSHQDEWLRQFEAASQGRYLRDEFIWAVASLEFQTAGRVRRFYLDCWEPFVRAKGLQGEPDPWFVYLPATVADWKASFDRIGYPYDCYGPHYDLAIRYRHWKANAEQEYALAVQAMERRLNSKEFKAQLAEITRKASERTYLENRWRIGQERLRNRRREPALERWNEQLAKEAALPREAPHQSKTPVTSRVTARPGDHPGETSYSNADDSGFRAQR